MLSKALFGNFSAADNASAQAGTLRPNCAQHPLSRRALLSVLPASALALGGTWASHALGQSNRAAGAMAPADVGTDAALNSLFTPPLSTSARADLWRVMSRIAYGPSPALLRELQAVGDTRRWALAQVDAAWSASLQAPRMASELADFNAPLPVLFENFRLEREARKNIKAGAADDAPQLGRMNFSAATAPEHFSRRTSQQAAAWRLTSASQTSQENPLLARMTEFWFNHLNVSVGKAQVRPFLGHYVVNVARAHALGKFEDLLLASAKHPAMLEYLDQVQSVAEDTTGPQGKKRGLNENYARELMELHTLGVNGGYTQTDVRELARVLTGWTISRDDASGFRFAPRVHDGAPKLVLGQTFPITPLRQGVQEGEDAIRMLARHPATAKRVCTRLAQFFIADSPTPIIVKRLSDTFLQTQGDLREVMRALLAAPEFWDPAQRLFKTPMDFAMSALAATQPDATADAQASVSTGAPLNATATLPATLPTAVTAPAAMANAPTAAITNGNTTTTTTTSTATATATAPTGAASGASATMANGPDRRALLQTVGFLNSAGQPLHAWPTPDGYKFDAATWLAPEALTRRADFALQLARQTPQLDFLLPFYGESTRQAVAQERPNLRAGLLLASPEFMYK